MNIKIDIYLIILGIFLTFLRQIDVYLSFYIFVILHELAHILIAVILKVNIKEVNLLPFGVNAKFDFYNHKVKEIIIASAGPIFSMTMAFIFKQYFIENLFIFITNIIPIYPLDGGRILKNLIIVLVGKKIGIRIYNALIRFFILILAILNIVLIVFLKNYNFIFFSMYILQMACEEIKKDKVKEDIIKMLNVDI